MDNEYTCRRCKKDKNRNEMARHINNELRPYCWDCWEKDTPEDEKKRFYEVRSRRRKDERDWHRENIEYVLWRSAKARAKKQNLPFSLTIDDIIIPEVCPVLGIKIKQGEFKTENSSPSLDKVVPEKGYTKENARIISWRANNLKKDGTKEEFEKILKYIKENSNENH